MSEELSQTIDDIVMSLATHNWQKVAMIVGACKEKSITVGLDISLDDIAARLYELVAAGRLESAGNIQNWRYSEVRRSQ